MTYSHPSNHLSRPSPGARAASCALAAVLGWCSFSLQAQPEPAGSGLKAAGGAIGLKPARTEVEAGYSRENLSNSLPDWTSTYLLGSHRFGERRVLYGGLRETRRFGLDDSEVHAGLYYPLGASWTAQVEGSLSPTHEVLAKHSIYGQLQKSLPGGWGVGVGLRHNEYTLSASNVVSLLAERYWGNFRGAYTLYSGRPEGGSSGASHRVQLSYYYADRSSVGISFSDGREVENVGPPRGLLSSDVRNWTLSGQHWLTPAWALTYDLVNHEQGSLYRRQGLRLGIRHSF
ncbi:MAG: YaiO family outer membrane beta-barrel protein [Burkholderiales bacterium]|nr:YaiO family outer membrane beta-barrel protein [Burkholderiales bacterium]